MRRLHLIEIHEQRWCPAVIRDGATDSLMFLETVAGQYRNVLPLLRNALAAAGSHRCVDLCSGAGGPWPRLEPLLNDRTSPRLGVVLTDLHPNLVGMQHAAAKGSLEYCSSPVDALHTPQELTGFRTLFTAFHHFEPRAARALLQDAVDRHEGIGIFEQTARNPMALLLMFLLPLLTLLALPFVRPFRWSRLLWTLVPVIPLVLCFDGLVSCLRTYTLDEIRDMAQSLRYSRHGSVYRWDIGRVPSPLSPIGVRYALGVPSHRDPGAGPRVA